MVVMSVMYPSTEGGHFDYDYYVNTHIPLVRKNLGPTGLKDVQVLKGLPVEGGQPLYVAIANLIFESPEAFGASVSGPAIIEVRDDIPNFTNIEAVRQVSALG